MIQRRRYPLALRGSRDALGTSEALAKCNRPTFVDAEFRVPKGVVFRNVSFREGRRIGSSRVPA